jgi:hypothetical protein
MLSGTSRRLATSRFARCVSVYASLALPVVAVPLAGLTALLATNSLVHAQAVASVVPGAQTAVVIDFDVAPGLDPVLGRKAADAVAVELKSSGDFDVVARQRMEEVVATVPGLRPPYTPGTARRLGEAVGANTLILGRVVSASIFRPTAVTSNRASAAAATSVRGRVARVEIEMRQMDVRTGDFVNGAQPIELTSDEFNELDDDVLMDQSLDKAAYSGVRAIRLIVFPEATITVTSQQVVDLNKGFRDGLRKGHRYAVTRDHYSAGRRIVERIKIAEIQITNVTANESSAVIVGGGGVGVRTGDKARRIFAPGIPFTEPKTEVARTSRARNTRR